MYLASAILLSVSLCDIWIKKICWNVEKQKGYEESNRSIPQSTAMTTSSTKQKEETDVLQNWGVLKDYSKSEFKKLKMKERNTCFTLFVKTFRSAYM